MHISLYHFLFFVFALLYSMENISNWHSNYFLFYADFLQQNAAILFFNLMLFLFYFLLFFFTVIYVCMYVPI